MPQFVFRATDRMGNTVEGNVTAESQAAALTQVRGMGYTPLQVQPKGAGAPNLTATQPMAAASVTATQPLHAAPSIAVTQPIPAPSRPRLIDLSAPVEEIAGTTGSHYGLPGTEAPSEGAAPGHLEPWERSVGLNDYPAVEQTTEMAPNGVEPTQALSPGSPPPSGAARAAGRVERVTIERSSYESRDDRDKPLPQRFKERVLLPIFSGVVMKDLAPFYRQFATLINAGIPLYQALSALESSTKNPKLKEIARAGQLKVQAGGRFSDVMAEYPWICSPMQIEIVRAAEQGGMLDTSLRQVADYVENDLAIRRLISRETIYPKIVLFVALMLLGRPGFMFGQMAIVSFVLGGMGKSAYTGADYLKDTLGFGILCLFPIVACIICFRLFLFNSVSFREAYDSFKTSIPVLGNLIRMFATAKFCRTFAALYRGGFPMGSALQVAGNASGNFVLRKAAYRAAVAANRGEMVGDSMRSSGFFNAMTVDMFRTGETSGNLDLMVDKIAEYYESEGQLKSHQAALILGVGVFLLVAILVAIQVISQYSGVTQGELKAGEEGFLRLLG